MIVPIAHVIACTLFLAGYCTGFGGNIATLFKPSDFFTVTLDHMVLMYTTGLIVPVVTVVARHRAGVRSASDEIALEQDQTKRAAMTTTLRRMRRTIVVLCLLMGIISAALLILSYRFDTFVPWYLGLSFFTVSIAPFWWQITTKLNFLGVGIEFAWLTLSFLVGVFGLGLDNGELDRREAFSELRPTRYACGKLVILATAGDRFIAASKSGVRSVIDEECKVQFNFAKAVPISDKPLGSLVREWLSAPPRSSTTPVGQR